MEMVCRKTCKQIRPSLGGGRNTLAFMSAFLFTKSNSGINAVSVMFKQLDLEEKGEVSNVPIFGFKRFTQESVDSDTVMTAEAFADIWLNFFSSKLHIN